MADLASTLSILGSFVFAALALRYVNAAKAPPGRWMMKE